MQRAQFKSMTAGTAEEFAKIEKWEVAYGKKNITQ